MRWLKNTADSRNYYVMKSLRNDVYLLSLQRIDMLCKLCEKYSLESISENQLYCPSCNTFFEKSSFVADIAVASATGVLNIAVASATEILDDNKKQELRPMAGKRPVYRMVIGKRTVGVLWDAVAAKSGLKYFSGNIDVTELKSSVAEKGTQKKSVRINREGATAEHDMIRVALFEAKDTKDNQSSSSKSW